MSRRSTGNATLRINLQLPGVCTFRRRVLGNMVPDLQTLLFRFTNTEPPEFKTAVLAPVTHSLSRFTKGEKIPAGKVVKPHPVSSLTSTTSSNGQEDGGVLARPNRKNTI